MNKESIETLARRLAASLPQGLLAVKSDVEENFRAVLKSSLARMDLVTREEFEVQEAVLLRTRAKLEALEARLDAHEARQQAAPAVSKKAGKKSSKKKPASKASRKKTAD